MLVIREPEWMVRVRRGNFMLAAGDPPCNLTSPDTMWDVNPRSGGYSSNTGDRPTTVALGR